MSNNKIYIDINHPAHVHYFRNFIKIMEEKGHRFVVSNRDDKMINYLLDYYKISHYTRNKRRNNKSIWNVILNLLLIAKFCFFKSMIHKLDKVYKAIKFHLNDNRLMFHEIEFHSHNITKKIDGHYQIPTFLWNLIFGKRLFFLNRWKLQDHITYLNLNNFNIIKISEFFVYSCNYKVLTNASILAFKYK